MDHKSGDLALVGKGGRNEHEVVKVGSGESEERLKAIKTEQ